MQVGEILLYNEWITPHHKKFVNVVVEHFVEIRKFVFSYFLRSQKKYRSGHIFLFLGLRHPYAYFF